MGIAVLFIFQRTTKVPTSGGTFSIGLIGQPVSLNPITATSDVDRSILGLFFAPLKKTVEKIEVERSSLSWNIRLKDNLSWPDGALFTSDDIIFTVKKIQEAQNRSSLYSNWQGVVTERVSERELKFILPAPYSLFDHNIENLYVLPQHLFNNIPLNNWSLSDSGLTFTSTPIPFSAGA